MDTNIETNIGDDRYIAPSRLNKAQLNSYICPEAHSQIEDLLNKKEINKQTLLSQAINSYLKRMGYKEQLPEENKRVFKTSKRKIKEDTERNVSDARKGFRPLAIWVPKEISQNLKTFLKTKNMNIQNLIIDSINKMFKENGMPEIASGPIDGRKKS